jgi:hypothetical protein
MDAQAAPGALVSPGRRARGDLDPGQEDLFGFKQAAREQAAEAAVARALDLLDCCTGLAVVVGDDQRMETDHGPWTRCGRCGMVIRAHALLIDHDMGWGGCYQRDPIASPSPYSRQFTRAEMNHRHDARHRPPCTCGDAWGLHKPVGVGQHDQRGAGHCHLWCGCQRYQPNVTLLICERPDPRLPASRSNRADKSA